MPNNTVITMDDLTTYTTKLKNVLDTNYSGSGSSGSGSSGSTRVDSGKTKLSELVDVNNMNECCTPFELDSTGTGFIDASNNKDCCALYKEGNKGHFEVYGGLQLKVGANTTITKSDYFIPHQFLVELPSGFIPNRGGQYGSAKLVRIEDSTHDEYGIEEKPIPVIIFIDIDYPSYIMFTLPDVSLLSNDKNYTVYYNFIIDYDYMLES